MTRTTTTKLIMLCFHYITNLSLRSAFTPPLIRISNSKSRVFSIKYPTARHEPVEKQAQIVQNMLYRIKQCNEIPVDIKLIDFKVENEIVGRMTEETAELFLQFPIFEKTQLDNASGRSSITLTSNAGATPESRTESIMSIMQDLREKSVIKGWRDELYPVSTSFYSKPKFLVERAAAPFLGIQQYGVHLNGLTYPDYNMWIGRRSASKSKYPNMLDHLVAGGQPHDLSLIDNVIKECEEEAGVPYHIAKHSQPVGAINYQTLDYCTDSNLYLVSRSVLFNFDLLLPNDFIPTIVDGEVQEFFVWKLDQVVQSMAPDYHDPIKPNCYLVIIDFLMRIGYISPDTEGYLDVLKGLRNHECR